jgi:DNA-binding beta-propeller fold protein YncE
MKPVRLALLLGALATACHQRRPMPALPVEPQPPPPEGVVVPPPGPPPPDVTAPAPMPATTYRLLATAESADQVALIVFKPCQPAEVPPTCGARVERTYDVGRWPLDIEGPHGVVASPDGKAFYVSIAHGRPFGRLEKYDLATGRRLGAVELGMFPATVDVSPSGTFVYAINFNFEDPDMGPSSLSIVLGDSMTEVARPETCRMPHGSRLNPQGTMHYSGCMMNDLLVEVDARTMMVRRLFRLAPGKEGAVALAEASTGMSSVCSPTWAQPSADGSRVYVACNKSGEIVEVDVASWSLVKRWKTPPAPYNLAVTPDGKLLVATQKGPGTVTIWRLADDTLMAQIAGTRKIASGVAVSRDSRYAFVTLEGIGGDPGTIDIIDLKTLQKVASVEIGKQAEGIAVMP